MQGQKFFVIGSAQLQFLNNLTEQLRIVRRCTGEKNIFRSRKITGGKESGNFRTGKMNPIDFGFIGSVIEVFLDISGMVKNHGSFRKDMFFVLDEEMRFSRGNI